MSTIQGYENLLVSGTNSYGWQHITYCSISRVHINYFFNKIDKKIHKYNIINYKSTMLDRYDNI